MYHLPSCPLKLALDLFISMKFGNLSHYYCTPVSQSLMYSIRLQ